MDADITNGIERCNKLLNSVNEDVDLNTNIARQFHLKKIHLLTTAEVITNVLHKSAKMSKKRKYENIESEFYNINHIDEESKTTRRNAHYKSTVLVMFYYIIYYAYYNKEPKNIGYELIIQNHQARQYIESNTWLMNKLYTKKQQKKLLKSKNESKLNKMNKIAVQVGNEIEYKPIQHYNQFKQYTYDIKLAKVIDGSMKSLIKFGYENFNKYCREYISINLVIKYKEKLQFDIEKRSKKKPIRYNESEVNDIDDIPISESIQKDCLENNELVNCYMNLSIDELKIKLKEPSVLLKFYQAFLFECDWELLFQYLLRLLNEGFCYATMMKLLIYLICNVTKLVCIASEREGHNRNLDILLKQYKYREVILQLQLWTHNYKYSIYTLPKQDINNNIKAFDLRCFKDLARNTKDIYFHITSNPVKLEIKEMEFDNYALKYIEYTLDSCNKVFFDLIKITITTCTTTKIDLSNYSWQERLNKADEIFKKMKMKENTATLNRLSKRTIQFDKLPCGKSVCHYIRTSGLGIGTLFFSANNKKVRCTNMPNKRFRKITIEDLEYKKLKSGIDNIDQSNQSPNYEEKPHCSTIIPPLSHMLSQLITQYQNLVDTDNSNNNISSSQVKEETSPIPSPKHDLNSDYIGELLVLNNTDKLEFTKFKAEDDI